MAKIDIQFKTKMAEKPYPLGLTYLYSPYKGVPPPPAPRVQPLAEWLPELAAKLERLDCFHWFYSEHRRENQRKLWRVFELITRRVSDDTKLLRSTSLGWREIATKQTSVTTQYVSVTELFYKNTASRYKQIQLDWCFLSLFYFLSIFTSSFSSVENLFISLRALSESCKIFVQLLHYCCQQWSPWAMFTAE